MLYIPVTSPSALSSIVNLDWMSDRIDASEAEAINWINNFGDADVMSSVVSLGWVQDGIEGLEVEVIQQLSYIDYNASEVAATVIALGWVQDGIDEVEFKAVDELSGVARDDVGVASSVITMGWVQDGIEELEAEAFEWINNFSNAVSASLLVDLQWVADGIEDLEVKAIEELSYIDFYDADVTSSVLGLGWLQESVGEEEFRAIGDIRLITRNSTADALRIITMPFLETLDPPDVPAVKALSQLASFREDDFQRVLSHPTISIGITDDWAKIVATLYGVSKNNAQLIDTLLDPAQVTIEERTIGLSIAGETELTIIRTGSGAQRSMDLLEHAVHHAEEYMATSFPTGYVGWLFGDAVTPTFAGTNFGTHIASLAQYDVDDDSHDAEVTGSHTAHEVAHYYWTGNAAWVDEGLANFMASVSENTRIGQPIEVTEYPCGYVRTIAELEALDITNEAGADSAFICNYALGERLFMDLYRSLGEDSFRQGLRNLYTLSQTVQENDEEVGIEHVRTALKDVDGVDDQIVDVITARWYEGTEPYDTSGRDIDPVNRRFVTVNGGIDVAYLAATSGGPPATSFSAKSADDWVRLFLDYSYSVGNNTEVPLEIVTYFEDGFVFNRQNENFTAKPGYIGATWWLSVGASPSNPWAPGKYYVYVYNEGRKLVELEYEVTD